MSVVPVMLDTPSNETQRHILSALLIGLLYEKSGDTEEKKLLLELAIERHGNHTGDFDNCTDYKCKQVRNLLVTTSAKEAIFEVNELQSLVKKYSVHCERPIAGVTRVWLEEQGVLLVL